MNRVIRRFGVVTVVVATGVALTACGGDDGPVPAATQNSQPAPQQESAVAGDNPAADALEAAVDDPAIPDVYLDLRTALGDFDPVAADLSTDLQAKYTQLKADLDHAEGLTGASATEGYATVKDDIDAFGDLLASAEPPGVDQTIVDAWSTVKHEFDQIDAGF